MTVQDLYFSSGQPDATSVQNNGSRKEHGNESNTFRVMKPRQKNMVQIRSKQNVYGSVQTEQRIGIKKIMKALTAFVKRSGRVQKTRELWKDK